MTGNIEETDRDTNKSANHIADAFFKFFIDIPTKHPSNSQSPPKSRRTSPKTRKNRPGERSDHWDRNYLPPDSLKF